MTDQEYLDSLMPNCSEQTRAFYDTVITKQLELADHRATSRTLAIALIQQIHSIDDIHDVIRWYHNDGSPESLDALVEHLCQYCDDSFYDELQIQDAWHFGFARSLGQWRLFPWITSERRGWKFTWLFLLIERTY